MKKTPKNNYLHFTRREKNGILVLLVIVVSIMLVPLLYGLIIGYNEATKSDYKKELAQLELLKKDSTDKFSYNRFPSSDDNDEGHTRKSNFEKETAGTMFYFDPNTLDNAGWVKLGVKPKTATGIQHYIEKGGRFKQPDDVNKIWGISDELKKRIIPYVRISATPDKISNYEQYPAYEKKVYEKKTISSFNINDGDTTAFIALPGIGSKLAGRIVAFRDKLGGFYSVDQVGETFGLADSTFQKIKPFLKLTANGVRQININTATQDELKAHPYIRWQLANVIFQYRTQHGNFSSVNDLRKIMVITDDIFNKVAPYLKIN